jgi:two-component system nitrogen regulation sensor histidine kinase NtrY
MSGIKKGLTLKTRYILFIATLHLIFFVLCFLVFREDKLYFIASETFILVSLSISVGLYRQLVEPLTYIKDGINAIKDRDFNVKFVPTGKSEVDELIHVYNQMMDALREERTRQEAQHFFLEKLIHTSPTGIIILDYDNQLKQVNPQAQKILGTDGSGFINQLSFLKVGESKTLRIGGINTYKVQKSHFIDRGFARVFVMIEEVTEEIFEAEKNAYGKVIRMMAHEVNNTIGPVNSILSQALSSGKLWESENSNSLKKAMQVAVDRNHNLNLFMRNFADLVKLLPVNKIKTELASLLRSVVIFMQQNMKQNRVRFELGNIDAYYIMADPPQLEQALINIVKNAIEAIEGVGVVSVDLDQVSGILRISDTGKGVSDAMSEHLFSPFFSTKKDGQGIGLTLVREVLLNHGFQFSLTSPTPGRTDFIIRFH